MLIEPELICYRGSVIAGPLVIFIDFRVLGYCRGVVSSLVFVLAPQVSNCLTSSCNPRRLGLLMPLKLTPLQTRMKEQRGAVD
jgi:hypothetical protein